jgi:hypothetical protein
MVMEKEHMIDGDRLGDDGGEDDIKTTPPQYGQKNITDHRNEDRNSGDSFVREKIVLHDDSFLGYINMSAQRRARYKTRGPNGAHPRAYRI